MNDSMPKPTQDTPTRHDTTGRIPPAIAAPPVRPHPSRLLEIAALLKATPSRERDESLRRIVSRTGVECVGISSERPGQLIFDCVKMIGDESPQPTKIRVHYEWNFSEDTGILSSARMIGGGT